MLPLEKVCRIYLDVNYQNLNKKVWEKNDNFYYCLVADHFFLCRPSLKTGSDSTAITSALMSSPTHVMCLSWAQDYKVMS